MKRLLLLMVQLLTIGLLSAQTNGYNPENPDEPFLEGYPHRLSLSASPENGGYFGGYSSVEIVEGDSMYIYAYPYSSFRFVCWKENGFVISTSNPVKYTMGTTDSHLTAEFVYDPTSPADPLSEGYMHRLKLIASPSNAGYFNSSSTNYIEMPEGKHQFVYAYPRNGFSFVCWKKNGSVISTENPYEYVMGTGNDVMTAQFAYNPANPGNPGVNYFNPATGEVIIDEFSSGDLYSVLANLVGNNASLVRTITVTGRMSYWDGGVMAEYPTLTSIDLSRVSEYYTLASYAFDYDSAPCSLRTLYLPSSINYIQKDAFNGCDSLTEINCFAITPPEVDSFSLRGIPSTAIVYVPAVALQLYLADPFWRTLNIRPMDGNIVTLKAQLPPSINLADYAGMFVQLHNTQNGMDVRYAVTDQSSFTFDNLVTNTHYNLQVVNQAAQIFGRIDNIRIGENDTTVTFDSLSVPHTVLFRVKTPQGEDVTDSVSIQWFDVDGNYICKGDSLSSQISGTRLKISFKLNSALATRFSQASLYPITVSDTGNSFTYILAPITKVLVSGVVKDNMTGNPVPNAKIVVHQRINGKYDVNVSMNANENGVFSDSVISSDAVFKVSAQYYLQKSDSISESELMSGKPLTLTLPALMGQYVNIGYTYQESVRTGEQAPLLNYYPDVNNVTYSLKNLTTNENLIYSTNSPLLLRLSTHQTPGDTLQITASSRNGRFKDVSVRFVVDSSDAMNVTIPIVEYGSISLSYGYSEANEELSIIYDSLGHEIDRQSMTSIDDTVKVSYLPDGNYITVVIDYSSDVYYPTNLNRYAKVDLVSGRDFVIDTISVVSGQITDVNIDTIPHYNVLRQNFYDKNNSAIILSNYSITAGNYVTVTAKIVIPDTIVPLLSNANISFDLPSGISFINGSVMLNKTVTSSYTYSGNTLTIPFDIAAINDIKFCVIPSETGSFNIDGLLSTHNVTDTLFAVISSAKLLVEPISIYAPTITAEETITISGSGKTGSTIEVYDNNILIGTTLVKANDTWSGKFPLENPSNISHHKIHAVMMTNGVSIISPMVDCTYDRNAIQPSSVTMYYNSYTLVYDYLNQDKNPGYLSYAPGESLFKFDIAFTTIDTSRISNVMLYVQDNNNQWFMLYADYDTIKTVWHTEGIFEPYSIPVKVAVDYSLKSPRYFDISQQREAKRQQDSLFQQLSDSIAHYDILLNTIDSLFANVQDTTSLYQQIDSLLGITEYVPGTDAFVDSLLNLSEAELIAYFDSAFVLTLEDSLMFAQVDSIYQMAFLDSLSSDGYHLNIYDCDGLTPQLLLSSGYIAFPTTDGDTFYVYLSEYMIKTVDFSLNQMIVITKDSIGGPLFAPSINFDMLQSLFNDARESAQTLIQSLQTVMDIINIGRNFAAKKRLEAWEKIRQYEGVSFLPKGLEKFNAVKATATKWVKLTRLGTIGNMTSKILNKINPIQALSQAIIDMQSMLTDMDEWNTILGNINAECANAIKPASQLENEAYNLAIDTRNGYRVILAADAFSLAALTISHKLARGWYGIPVFLANIAVTVASIKYGTIKVEESNAHQNDIIFRSARLKDFCVKKPKPKKILNPNSIPNPHPNSAKVGIDPSGFVYEGVESNRLEGVTASCYYKETVEDMYGNLVDNVNLWDAEEYDQENPLLTDSMGMYQWFVPVGLWQVKLEKTGYETAYSDWLPVPPPQLDVNIGMVQNVQPTVVDAAATKTAVEFEFDKYMMTGYLDTSNIHVYQNGNYVQGTIEFVNAEQAYANPDSTYASAVRFVPDSHFAGGQLSLIVSNRVRSYSGIRMQETFVRTLTLQSQDYLFEENDSICQGDALTWHGKRYTVSGVYYDSLKSVDGMDSVYKLTLTVNPVVTIPVNITACANDELPEWAAGAVAGNTYHHYDTLVASTGCDSIIHTTLKVNPTYFNQQNVTWPSATGNYNWHGKVISASGVYYDSLTTVNTGCDSVFQLNITFADKYLFEESHAICQGDYYDWRGQRYTQAGVYYDSLKTADQIDSIYKLTLTVSQNYFFTDVYAICQGETYRWHDMDFTAAGIYYDSLLSSTGCDSVYELTLTVNPTYLVEDSAELAEDGSGYMWHGKTYSVAGDYVDSLSTVFGCDSICILHLANPIHSGVEETSRIIDVKVVPNPVKAGGTAYISADWTDEEIDGMTIEVITATGAVVSRITPETQTTTLGGISLQGIYFIRITTGTEDVYIRKLIVK